MKKVNPAVTVTQWNSAILQSPTLLALLYLRLKSANLHFMYGI